MSKKPLEKWWLDPKVKSGIGLKTEKKPCRKTLIKKADSAMSKYIIARDGKCVLSFMGNCSGRLTNGHLFSRVSYSLRWDERQCFCQCSGHNLLHEFDSQPFTSWFIKKFGIELYDKLHTEWKQTKKFKDYEIAEKITEYELKLKEL